MIHMSVKRPDFTVIYIEYDVFVRDAYLRLI